MIINLNNSLLINNDGNQDIYHHPHNQLEIIKVTSTNTNENNLSIFKLIPYYIMPYKRKWWVKDVSRSYRQYLNILAKNERCQNYIAGHHGFVQTSLGIGCVYEKICDNNEGGNISLTIDKIIMNTNCNVSELSNALDIFFNRIYSDLVIIQDLHLGNLCVVRNTSGNYENIVLVDGLGENTLIPRRISSVLYSYWHNKKKLRLYEDINRLMLHKMKL